MFPPPSNHHESFDQSDMTRRQSTLAVAKPVATPPLLTRIWSLRSRATRRARNGDGKAADVIRLCHTLLSERGQVSGVRVAADVLAAYKALTPAGRDAFFDLLSGAFLPDPERVAHAAHAYRDAPSSQTFMRLQAAAEPPRQELFRRLNLAPGATAALIELRRHLMRTLATHPERAGIDADLTHLFRGWFNGGFLVLRRIDWRTSAVVLERLIEYEAVHQIQGWGDLRRRLEADRRCYAFFHPALPDDPLIFIEVALTERMSDKIQPLLDPGADVLDPAEARCAIFYSITHCQEGLRGISFGSLLIKQVVEDLERSFPRVRTFATLSPIPDFRRWVTTQAPSLLAQLETIATASSGQETPPATRETLTRLCAHYLLHAKREQAPFDSVARFHLANGARLERLNWLADTSHTGFHRSYGLMANYVYAAEHVERNHEACARPNEVVASREIERQAAGLVMSDW
jgi:malonyl-CoA decarboxylase